MSDKRPTGWFPRVRTDLGDGWYLVSDPADVLDEDSPESTLIRLEGPGGVVVRFPFDQRYEALPAIGVRRKRRKLRRKPGPDPTEWHKRLAPTIAELYRSQRRVPSQRKVAEALHVSERTLARWLAELNGSGLSWSALVQVMTEDPTPRA